MDTENEQALEGVEEQEENTQEFEETEEESEETITIPKSKLTKLQRKAKAYDATKEKPRVSEKIQTTSSDAKWRERMELKVDGYDDQAVDFILKNGGRKALENPFVVKALEGIKEQRIAEQATIDSGTTSETEKRFNPKDFAKLSADEQLKVLSELQ